ncbi:CHC2 zinc finger domain-containing protein [Vibrio sp. 10N.261.46.E12]|uniref:CHC2 zinc finger domain-containing protein n=1 Tax=unclassified Vibrio TaxID=2614977 RepID=UPI0009775483|nr:MULTISPECIES: CHC2 zinc finger domain-containing protein [unclassified Vibrio]OMO36939.1 hypothetical protein BH584_24350 [Vibrio sp. 10N.261.45.E1]PMJ36315.1 hypothetical protein BCU27_02250 [Vibrio sp. 10N.286.45.B6]PML93776.1 hypothetical protein BCT66_24185 [Vibrio sp. 10N.261.49.E11]PMM83218.1 hypothetical protein BCT46_12775 [Vibrio sp. 10N.261.46.E8]PMN48906.1 hypothetical protein BCT32_06820 [Vibrio sp. 10N.261.45.E11]
MPFLPSFVIDEIKSRVSIVDVLDREIGLQKLRKISGDDKFQACCPFHDDKSPSLVINNDVGTFHCFGCNAHGDAIDVFKDNLGFTFKQAIEKLCEYTGYDLKSIQEDIRSIDQVKPSKSDKNSLPLTNFLFNQLTTYNPYSVKKTTDGIKVPSSFLEMSVALNKHCYLANSGDGSSLVNAINNDPKLESIAVDLELLADGKVGYFHNKNFLPLMTISKIEEESSLPYIVNDSQTTRQISCTGFLVLDEELDIETAYPESIESYSNSILFPPPSQMDMFDRVEEIYIAENADQYIELVSSNVTNVTAPATSDLNHQHLRQMSYLPTKELTWVTTEQSIRHPQLLSKLAIFSETLGSSKKLNIVMLKNNDDNTPFSSLITEHPTTGFDFINSRKHSIEDVVRLAIPTIELLSGNQKEFAIRSSVQFIKKMLISDNDSSNESALLMINDLSKSSGLTKPEVYSHITGIGLSTIKNCLKQVEEHKPSNYKQPTFIDLMRAKESMNVDTEILLRKVKGLISDNDSDLFRTYTFDTPKEHLTEMLLLAHADDIATQEPTHQPNHHEP